MKILVLSFYFSPDLCAGSFRATALVEALLETPNTKVDVVTTMPNRYASFDAAVDTDSDNPYLYIHRVKLPQHKSGMLDQAKAFVCFYRKAMAFVTSKDYDLVFATSSRLFTAFLGSRVARVKGIPLYLDIRDIFFDTLSDVLNPYLFFLLKPWLSLTEKYTFNKATHINLVSRGFSDYFENSYKYPSYSYFTNGIDKNFIASSTITVNKVHKESAITVLYAGNIGEGQGLHHTIPQLAEKLGPKYQFTIIGDGGRRSILEKLSSGLVNVTLLPPVTRDELVQYYTKADILFLHLNDYPAFKKVLPSKIFEYAAMGKPILAGVSGYASTFIKDELDNARVFPPANLEEAVSQIKHLDLQQVDRSVFVNKYSRKSIMIKMASSIMTYVKPSLVTQGLTEVKNHAISAEKR